MADMGHNPESSELPVTPTADVQSGPDTVPPSQEAETDTHSNQAESSPPSPIVIGRSIDPPTFLLSAQNTVIEGNQPVEQSSASEPTAEEIATTTYLERLELSASFSPLDGIVNNLSALSTQSQTAAIEESLSMEPSANTEPEAEDPDTRVNCSPTVPSASSDPVVSIENDLPALPSSRSTSPGESQPTESVSNSEQVSEAPDMIVHITQLGPSSSSTSARGAQQDVPPSPPSSHGVVAGDSRPAEPSSAADANAEQVTAEQTAPTTKLNQRVGESAASPSVEIHSMSLPVTQQGVEQVPSELPASSTELTERGGEPAPSSLANIDPMSLPVTQPDTERVSSGLPASSTDLGEQEGEPPHICPNCGHLSSPSYPPCDCSPDSRPSSSGGLAASTTNFSFVDSEYERVLMGMTGPTQVGVGNVVGLRPHPPGRSEPVMTAPLPQQRTEDAEPLTTDVETAELSPPVDTQDEEPTRTDVEMTEGLALQTQSVSSPKPSTTPGHSTQPSSSAPTTMVHSPLSPFTKQSSHSSTSSAGSSHHPCGCHEFCQGEDRRKVFCPSHDPNIVESLQSAFENTDPSAPIVEPSTDSGTDARPHLATLGIMAEGERHPPVVSADPETFLNNLPHHDLSPPPGFNENQRVYISSEEPSSRSRAASPDRSGRLPPQPTTAPTEPVRDAISGQNSLDTQRSAPPAYTGTRPVSRPPGYMSMQRGDEYVAGRDSRRVIREQRNAAIRRGSIPHRGCADFCDDSPVGCRCCGAILDNIVDTCRIM